MPEGMEEAPYAWHTLLARLIVNDYFPENACFPENLQNEIHVCSSGRGQSEPKIFPCRP